MIPLPALSAIPWKLVAYGAVAICICITGWRIAVWREAFKALPATQEALQREQQCLDPSTCRDREKAAQAKADAASAVVIQGYEDELNALRNRPSVTRTVRLRCTARDAGLPVPSAAGTADGTGAPGGVVSGPAERDIDVAALYGLAADADELAARLRALQGWNKALATKP